jgi:hypothetical protein
MNNDLKRKWYQKKRFIIPIGVLFISVLSSSGDNTQNVYKPTANLNTVQQVQTVQSPVKLNTSNAVNPAPKPVQSNNLSNDNYYTNTAGNTVHSPAYSENNSIPVGATAKCRDGTYSFSQSRRGTCSHHGGVASWF